MIANRKFWEDLPADIRKQLEEALVEATRFNNAIAQKENAEAVETLRATKRIDVHTPTASELEGWKQALKPVYAATAARVPKETLDAVMKETAK